MLIGLSKQIAKVDRLSVEKYGKSSVELMLGAARAVFEVLKKQDLEKADICILCGKGNNAGDGFALASMLQPVAENVTLVLLCGEQFSEDAEYYFKRLPASIKIYRDTFVEADIYVDAVFGTGFTGELPENVSSVFQKVSQSSSLKIAIDIPSGVNADTGVCSEDAFQADITVTFEILKYAHILPKSNAFCGEIEIKDIGLADGAIQEVGIDVQLLDGCRLPKKSATLHKGSNGCLFSVVGCKQYQGAATLSTKAALRGGCGIVNVFVPQSAYLPIASKVDSAVIHSCFENKLGMFSVKALDKIDAEIKKRVPDAILVGSGIGNQTTSKKIVDFVLRQKVNCVVDGDGLRYLTDEMLQNREGETILTPHVAEFAAMLETDISNVLNNRFALCKAYSENNQCILVLKDFITIITLPDGKQWVLSAPNAGMAKGGSGDVLAGLIASFLAQGLDAACAARAGVWFHSAAGKRANELYGEYAMLPSDVISQLPFVLR